NGLVLPRLRRGDRRRGTPRDGVSPRGRSPGSNDRQRRHDPRRGTGNRHLYAPGQLFLEYVLVDRFHWVRRVEGAAEQRPRQRGESSTAVVLGTAGGAE